MVRFVLATLGRRYGSAAGSRSEQCVFRTPAADARPKTIDAALRMADATMAIDAYSMGGDMVEDNDTPATATSLGIFEVDAAPLSFPFAIQFLPSRWAPTSLCLLAIS